MRHPAIVMLAIFLVINAGCGRQAMTEDQAIDTLMEIPLSSSDNTSAKNSMDPNAEVTLENFQVIVDNVVASGEARLNGNARAAVSLNTTKVDLSALTQLMSLLQLNNGQRPTLLGLAKAFLALNKGTSAVQVSSKLDTILALIMQLAPIISMIAPQFAPMIMALTTLVPMVINIIAMFKKPTTTASGRLYRSRALAWS